MWPSSSTRPGLSHWPGAQGGGGLRVNAAVDPKGGAAEGSQLTASCSKFSARELRIAHLKAATPGMIHWLACPSTTKQGNMYCYL